MNREEPYLKHILQECDFLIEHSQQIEFEDFVRNPVLKRAFVRSLEIIGEAVKNLPEEFRTEHPLIPWKEIAGMRNKLIHEYFGVNYKVVWKTVLKDIPKLREQIRKILREDD